MGGAKSRPVAGGPQVASVSNNTQNPAPSNIAGVSSDANNANRSSVPRERGRYGVVNVKISSLAYANRRTPENETTTIITPRGAIFYGSATNPAPIQKALANCGVPMLPPQEIPISDSRAHKLMVIHTDDWYIVPSQEPFSRHSGTCMIIGDKKGSAGAYKIKLGDCFRLGSVGVVVSELKTEHDAVEQRLDARKLQYLKDEALAFDSEEDMAALASDEEIRWRQSNMTEKPSDVGITDVKNDRKSPLCVTTDAEGAQEDNMQNIPDTPSSVATMKSHFSPDKAEGGQANDQNYSRNNFNGPSDNVYGSGGITNGERFVCYMCYETHDTPSDPLVAPCDCKGDTRYLHVQCLQKWYHSSVAGPQARVIRTTGSGAPACKICGVAYKTTFKRSDGRRANLLEMECAGPYISLVVVTRHDTSPGLFNTKFRLNFGQLENGADALQDMGFTNSLSIGRSSTCNMILDYRTVSTVHAKISYEDGGFTIQDRESSNGTMVYLQSPVPLKFSSPLRIRMGRTTMAFMAKRTWTAALRSVLSSNFPSLVSSNENRNSIPAITSSNANANGNGNPTASGRRSTNRRSSSTGALPNNPDNSATGSSRRRLSGSVDIFLGSPPIRTLTADELQQIMAESNYSSSNTGSNSDSREDDLKLARQEIDASHSDNRTVTTVNRSGINNNPSNNPTSETQTNVRRMLFDEVQDLEESSNDVHEIRGSANDTHDDIEGNGDNVMHIITNDDSDLSRRSYDARGQRQNVRASSNLSKTPPLSPGRNEIRRDSSIVVSSGQDHHSFLGDSEDVVVGTSYDLLLESSTSQSTRINVSSAPMSPNRLTFDVDGAVTVPPARAFASHQTNDTFIVSRPSSRGLSSNANE